MKQLYITLGIVALAALTAGAYLIIRGEEFTIENFAGIPDSEVPQAEQNRLIEIEQTLNSISIDTTLFDEPAYQSLELSSLEIVDKSQWPLGRTNPFATYDPSERVDVFPSQQLLQQMLAAEAKAVANTTDTEIEDDVANDGTEIPQ